jgi:hypothetical protein
MEVSGQREFPAAFLPDKEPLELSGWKIAGSGGRAELETVRKSLSLSGIEPLFHFRAPWSLVTAVELSWPHTLTNRVKIRKSERI